MSNNYLVGTSGWYYYNWKDLFYPNNIKSADWLNYYSKHLKTTEINNSFYALPTTTSLKKWYSATADDFIFSLKAWNLITHKEKLINCENSLTAFLDNIKILEQKLGPILFQLPASLKKDKERLANFIKLLPNNNQYTIEFRSPDWHCAEILNLLRDNNIAFCIYELANVISPRYVTADFIYIRLHGREGRYRGYYDNNLLTELKNWLIAQNKAAYIYFDNTINKDDAIKNAQELSQLLS